MKTSILLALGLLGVASAGRHNHRQHHRHQKHAKSLSNQVLQEEIEQLQANYAALEKKYTQLSTTVHSFAQGPSPYGIAGAGGPALPSPQPFVRGEKQWMDNAQNIVDWEDNAVTTANTRLPYQSTAQVNGPAPYGLAKGKEGEEEKVIPGAPALPSPQPFVRGEKQWMDNGQNIVDWEDEAVTSANTRIPYQSTAQVEGPAPNGLAKDAKGKPIPGAPSLPAPQPFVRGEKQWMNNAQNIGDWGENQMVVANTRIPYQSTAQIEGPAPFGVAGAAHKGPALPSPQPFVRGEKQWMDNAQNIGDWGENQMTVANTRIPYQSTVQLEGPAPFGVAGAAHKGPALPSPQPFVRGEKQWMDNAQNIGDWGENQMTVANSRIPYQSTFMQTRDEDASSEYEKDVDMSILYEQDDKTNFPEKVIALNQQVPISAELIQVKQDDDPKKIEGMLMEDPNIPLNLRLLHIQTEEGDELIKIE